MIACNMKSDFIPYAKQSIDTSDSLEVSKALFSSIITRGPKVEEFERAVAQYCGAKHAVAFNSGSSALLAACNAAKVNQFDHVISTPNTFVATVGAGIQCHANPIFVDIDRKTGNFQLEKVGYALEKPISRGRYIVMPVHFSGIAVDMEALDGILTNPDTIVIEDAAHAI